MEVLPMTSAVEIEPEVILPVQLARRPLDLPERRLMLAVLEDALDIFRKHALTGRESVLSTEVDEWFASDDTSWPFAFVNVCDALGIDVGWLRARLARRRRPDANGARVVRLRDDAGSRHSIVAGFRRSA
jgi:hypothetical protein